MSCMYNTRDVEPSIGRKMDEFHVHSSKPKSELSALPPGGQIINKSFVRFHYKLIYCLADAIVSLSLDPALHNASHFYHFFIHFEDFFPTKSAWPARGIVSNAVCRWFRENNDLPIWRYVGNRK